MSWYTPSRFDDVRYSDADIERDDLPTPAELAEDEHDWQRSHEFGGLVRPGDVPYRLSDFAPNGAVLTADDLTADDLTADDLPF